MVSLVLLFYIYVYTRYPWGGGLRTRDCFSGFARATGRGHREREREREREGGGGSCRQPRNLGLTLRQEHYFQKYGPSSINAETEMRASAAARCGSAGDLL